MGAAAGHRVRAVMIESLNPMLSRCGQGALSAEVLSRFGTYLELLLRWNARVNLTAVRNADEILARHFVESIICARAIPDGTKTLLDLGSGAGFPGIPIALCRPEIAVTLAESNGKKAAFLREATRSVGFSARVHGGRAEDLREKFNCVALRAVDRMGSAVRVARELVRPGGYLALMTTRSEEKAARTAAGEGFDWGAGIPLPASEQRELWIGRLREPLDVPRGTIANQCSTWNTETFHLFRFRPKKSFPPIA